MKHEPHDQKLLGLKQQCIYQVLHQFLSSSIDTTVFLKHMKNREKGNERML
jgi:hypothetical protein